MGANHLREQLTNDTNKLSNEYLQKTKELKRTEEEFLEKQTQLSKLERELESLRNYQKFSKEEKSRLDEEIERLTIEKKRLISKLYFTYALYPYQTKFHYCRLLRIPKIID